MRFDRCKKLLIYPIIAIMITAFSGCSSFDYSVYLEKTKSNEISYKSVNTEISNDEITASNGILTLRISTVNGSFTVTDERTGAVHRSDIDDEYIEKVNKSPLQNQIMKSPVTIYYISSDNSYFISPKSTTVVTPSERTSIKGDKTELGAKLSFDLKSSGFKFDIVYELENESLKITVPAQSIEETGTNLILNFDLYPFFGSAMPEENGYFVYPDGCGAVFNFEDAKKISSSGKKNYAIPVYSEVFEELEKDGEYWVVDGETKYSGTIPAFGINKNGNGILASIENGETDAFINVAPSGYILDINRIYSSFTYRNTFVPQQSKTSVSGTNTSNQSNVRKTEKEPIKTDKSISYTFLEKEKSEYSDMANAYRKRLISQGKLKENTKDSAQPFVFDLFMGAIEDRIPFDKNITMTSFEQAEEIIKSFSEVGIEKMYVNLSGWSKGGMGKYPQNAKIDGKLGSKEKINSFINTANELGATVMFETNITDIRSYTGAISLGKGITTGINGTALTNIDSDRYLFNPLSAVKNMNENVLPNIPDKAGVSVEKIGTMIYGNYASGGLYTRNAEASCIWANMLKKISDNNLPVGVFGANSYLYASADIIFEMPSTDTGYMISSYRIPFVQMIVHGSIPYISAPYNSSNDTDIEKLRILEYGYTPFFRLTYENPEELMYTDFNYLFSTQYEEWIEEAKVLYEELSKISPELFKSQIISHKKLDSGLVSVTYSCGVNILLNYSNEEIQKEDITVGAKNYKVVKAEVNTNEKN